MKYIYRSFFLILCLMISVPAWTQPDLLRKARQKAEKRTEREAEKKIDESLDKVFETKEESSTESSTEQESQATPAEVGTATETAAEAAPAGTPTGVLNWAKYDFVPGDKIIFEDDLMNEENGEFPSRWDLQRGVAEVAQLDAENVIMLRGGNPTIIPYLENSDQDYLPEVFTIEFDIYMGGTGGWADMYLYDCKNQNRPDGLQWSLEIRHDQLGVYGSES